MSLLKSLYTGVSGLTVNGIGLDVVSDNIANVNTIGFKRSRAAFQDLLSETLLGANTLAQLGGGAGLEDINQCFEQGSLQMTNSATDLAISGDGFFIVNGSVNGQTGNFYSRAGQFVLDNDGYLVNQSGLKVQGWSADQDGNISGTIGDLRITGTTAPPRATTSATIAANLDADATIGAAFDATDPEGTSNFNTSVTVFDSLGRSHQVELYFRKNSSYDPTGPTDARWEWYALVDGGEITGGTAGTYEIEAQGTLDFDENGALDVVATTTNDFDFAGAAQNQAIAFDFGDDITSGGTGLGGCTSFGGASSLMYVDQDGYSVGTILGVQIQSDGSIVGTYSNSESRVIGKVALANFANPQGLEKWGGNLWVGNEDSGNPIIGEANTGGRGAISPNSLEQSNVDLAEEFVSMIKYQRGFQASSRSITTADQLLQEVVNIKR
ncbi:MAG: flagellar hook protein FlgE [Deltaproteobacteria bacterium]|nr:flagellar hook protein FlgE [Deltaproteobacteria bacterium]